MIIMGIELKKGNIPDSAFDSEQLAKGIKIEMEHTDDVEIAKQIAKAHLIEFKNYYIELSKMEDKLKSGKMDYKEKLKKLKEDFVDKDIEDLLNKNLNKILNNNYPGNVMGILVKNFTNDNKEFTKARKIAINWARKKGILFDINNFGESYKEKLKNLKEDVADSHQKKILINTVKNPNSYLLGGPNAKEAEKILRTKFKYTDSMIKKLKESFKETLSTPIAKKIMNIVSYIGNKHHLTNGLELKNYKTEFLDELKKVSINKISYRDMEALEDNNFHTAVDILDGKNMISKESFRERLDNLKEALKPKNKFTVTCWNGSSKYI
jgi:hypothetical protein